MRITVRLREEGCLSAWLLYTSYALTVEPKTVLAHQISKNISPGPSDLHTITQFEYLIDHSPEYGLEQYEISNFSTLGFRSRHNGNYWAGVDYLGLGPSAHSYDRVSRQWNVSNNIKYCAAIEQGLPYFEGESLTAEMIYNETVMTHLRTCLLYTSRCV